MVLRCKGRRLREVWTQLDTQSTSNTPSASRRLFITWCTSIADGFDHAVTDEEFVENRSEPTALCGASVQWGPMELPPGRPCTACLAVLRAAVGRGAVLARQSALAKDSAESPSVLPRVASTLRYACANHTIGWFISNREGKRVVGVASSRPSSTVSVTSEGDRPEPPVAAGRHPAAAGVPAGEGTNSARALFLSPAQVAPDAVTVTTGARPAAQPGLPYCIDPSAVGAGLGGPNFSASPSSSLGATETASCEQRRAGTVVPPATLGQTSRRDDHQRPDVDLSSAVRVPGQQDGHRPLRPRRTVLLTTKPVELASPAWGVGRVRPERPVGSAPATKPTPEQR